MSNAALIEEELTFFGLGEREAEAIGNENDGLHNESTIIKRAAEAQERSADAA
jgi:hypothetical protein